MRKDGKNIAKARAAVTKPAYPLPEAVSLLKKVKYAKFDETVDLTMRLGVDTRHADQMVRGTVVLPHGLGKTKTVAVIATGDRQKEAHGSRRGFCGRRGDGGEDPEGKLDRLRRADCHAGHDEGCGPAGQGAGPEGPDAESRRPGR